MNICLWWRTFWCSFWWCWLCSGQSNMQLTVN